MSNSLHSQSSPFPGGGGGLLAAHLVLHIGIVLLEALGQALARGHVLLHAARDAAVLALGYRFGGEVVDAGGKAAVDEVAEELLWGEEG